MTEQDTSRPKDGPFAADSQVTDVDRRRLRIEIERIGRNEKSMIASALADAPELLRCPQVSCRVKPDDANNARRQEMAHEALKAALASLPLRDQWIGEAILAAPPYEGENVEQRKDRLDKDHGITGKAFKTRRPYVVGLIVEFLMRDDSEESDPSGVGSDHEALQAIEVVLVDATDLAYACHAYQFVCALDHALDRAKYWPSMFRRGNKTALLAAIYTSHMDLVISAGYCIDDQPYSLLRKGRLSNLPPESISSLRGPLRLIFGALPFASSYERADICREHLAPITDPLAERKRRDSHQALWTERFHGCAQTRRALTSLRFGMAMHNSLLSCRSGST